nr:hypothetical protein CFP56_77747 [Quercus suber]
MNPHHETHWLFAVSRVWSLVSRVGIRFEAIQSGTRISYVKGSGRRPGLEIGSQIPTGRSTDGVSQSAKPISSIHPPGVPPDQTPHLQSQQNEYYPPQSQSPGSLENQQQLNPAAATAAIAALSQFTGHPPDLVSIAFDSW